ncbi:hypothetical protein D3C75_1128010 [compost metagenome]
MSPAAVFPKLSFSPLEFSPLYTSSQLTPVAAISTCTALPEGAVTLKIVVLPDLRSSVTVTGKLDGEGIGVAVGATVAVAVASPATAPSEAVGSPPTIPPPTAVGEG